MDIMEFIRGKEVFVIAIIFIIAMTLYGHNRGFVKMALSFASIIITLAAVNFAAPYVSEYISENTAISGYVSEKVLDFVTKSESFDDLSSRESEGESGENDGKELIEGLPLPEILKEKLESGSGEELYSALGIDKIAESVAGSLSAMIIKVIVFVVLFIALSIGLRVLMHVLLVFTRLPVICGMNQLLGAGIGFVEAIFYIWIFMLLVAWLPLGNYSAEIFRQIMESDFLSFLYGNNLITVFILSLAGI